MKFAKFLAASILVLPLAPSAPTTGTLTGVVVDDKGAPLAGASVLYRTVPTIVRLADGREVITGLALSSGAKSAADGTFNISGMPAATYEFGVYGTQSSHLGSCEWTQGGVRVDLVDGQTAHLRFEVAEGTLVTFQVHDPRHQIVDFESLATVNGRSPLAGANFSVGIWAGSRYARAKLVSASGSTRTYQVAVPKTATLRLYLDTSLKVADANGAAIALRQQSSAIAASGQAEVVINSVVP